MKVLLKVNVMIRQKGPKVKFGISEPKLSPVEKSVIIRALQGDINSEREYVTMNPDLASYAERNIKYREELIAKIETL